MSEWQKKWDDAPKATVCGCRCYSYPPLWLIPTGHLVHNGYCNFGSLYFESNVDAAHWEKTLVYRHQTGSPFAQLPLSLASMPRLSNRNLLIASHLLCYAAGLAVSAIWRWCL